MRRAEDAIIAIEKLGDARVRAAVALPWLAAASDALCRELSGLARDKQVRLIVAAARSRDDAVASRRQHGRTEVKRLLDADALNAATIVAHAGWTSPRDLVDLRDAGAHVACCPSMSHRLGTGSLEFGRYPELLAFGVNVTLGSGSAMASNYIDVARQLYLFAGGAKTYRLDATSVPPETALEMATIRGAAAIGLEREIGSLEAGKKADITLFRMLAADWAPVINPVANLVFSSRGGAHTVLVDGNVLLAHGRLQSLDENRTLAEAQRCAEAIMARSGLGSILCAPMEDPLSVKETEMALRKFIIERDIPKVGTFERDQLQSRGGEIKSGPASARPRHPMGRELCRRRQDVLRLSRPGRSHHPQARRDQRFSRHQDHRGAQDDRPDDGEGGVAAFWSDGLSGAAAFKTGLWPLGPGSRFVRAKTPSLHSAGTRGVSCPGRASPACPGERRSGAQRAPTHGARAS